MKISLYYSSTLSKQMVKVKYNNGISYTIATLSDEPFLCSEITPSWDKTKLCRTLVSACVCYCQFPEGRIKRIFATKISPNHRTRECAELKGIHKNLHSITFDLKKIQKNPHKFMIIGTSYFA